MDTHGYVWVRARQQSTASQDSTRSHSGTATFVWSSPFHRLVSKVSPTCFSKVRHLSACPSLPTHPHTLSTNTIALSWPESREQSRATAFDPHGQERTPRGPHFLRIFRILWNIQSGSFPWGIWEVVTVVTVYRMNWMWCVPLWLLGCCWYKISR